METIAKIWVVLLWALGVLLLAGMVWPWYALWWLAVQNRKKALRYYGLPFAVLLLGYWAWRWFM